MTEVRDIVAARARSEAAPHPAILRPRVTPGATAARRLAGALALAAAVTVAAACGGGGSGDDTGADAGLPPGLTIVAPGDSIGLAPGASIELRVRHTSGTGEPVIGAAVTWNLIGGVDGTGGSSISAASTPTDAAGEAAVTFVAGAERVDLRVTADAPGSATATFYVSVSASGFAELEVAPRHVGGRGADEFARVEVRLYPGADLACADVDLDALPPSPLAPRTLADFDATATWPSVGAEEPYTLIAWGVHAVSGATVAVACADLPASALPPSHATAQLAVPDLPIDVPAQALVSVLDLAPLAAALDARGVDRPWHGLACPAGPGQLVLDWLVDALSGDGVLDGQVAQPTGLGAQIAARRGALGADGCRALVRGTEPSLDAALGDAVGTGFPTGAALTLLLARRDETITGLTLSSELTVEAGAIHHRLDVAEAGGAAAPPILLAETARPVLTATAAAGPAIPGPWPIADHGFTLRAGSLLRDTFDVAALAPLGLGGRPAGLGQALVDAVEAGPATGCAAVSALVCDAIGGATGCADQACAVVGFALDGALAAWWRAADGQDLDLTLGGAADLADLDGDLAADPIASGTWAARLILLDGEAVETPGAFASGIPAQ